MQPTRPCMPRPRHGAARLLAAADLRNDIQYPIEKRDCDISHLLCYSE